MPSAVNLQNRCLLKYLAMCLSNSGYSTISSVCRFRLVFPVSRHKFSWKSCIKLCLQLQLQIHLLPLLPLFLPELVRLLDQASHLQEIPCLNLQE